MCFQGVLCNLQNFVRIFLHKPASTPRILVLSHQTDNRLERQLWVRAKHVLSHVPEELPAPQHLWMAHGKNWDQNLEGLSADRVAPVDELRPLELLWVESIKEILDFPEGLQPLAI